MQPGTRRVQRQLADRNHHAAGTLVTEAEDALTVGDHNQPHVGLGEGAEDFLDAAPMVGRDPHATAAPEDMTEVEPCLAHRRRINDRHELDDVLRQQPVKERLVAVLEVGEPDVLLERIGLAADGTVGALGLLLDGVDLRGKQSVELERVALFLGERGSLVQQGVPKHFLTALRDFDLQSSVGFSLEMMRHRGRSLLGRWTWKLPVRQSGDCTPYAAFSPPRTLRSRRRTTGSCCDNRRRAAFYFPRFARK